MSSRSKYWQQLGSDKLAMAAIGFLVLLAAGALFGSLLVPHDPNLVQLSMRNMPPGSRSPDGGAIHLLGTDPLGRDELARLLAGARITLSIGLVSVVLSGVFGVAVGLIAGYYRGLTDEILMRLVDLWMSIPTLLVALMVLYSLGGGVTNLILVLAAARWMSYARLTRGLMLSVRKELYVEAAVAIGARDRRIVFAHMLPNIRQPVLVLATLEIATVMLAESALSFLGLGVQPPATSWGQMLSEGREYIGTAWWLVTFPGLAILLTALSLNLIANWLRTSSSGRG